MKVNPTTIICVAAILITQVIVQRIMVIKIQNETLMTVNSRIDEIFKPYNIIVK